MTFSRPGRRALALGCAAVLALGLAACGGDDDSADETTTTTTAAAESTTTTKAEEETTTESTEPEEEGPDAGEAEELAESINLTLDDFADGWSEEPSDGGDDELNTCFQDVDLDDAVAEVDSPTFSIQSDDGARGQVVSMTTVVLADEDEATALVDEVATNQFAGCAEDALIASIEEDGTELNDSGIEPVEDTGGLGDGAAGLAGAISFTGADGTEYSGQLAFYFIRTGNVVSGMSLLDLGDVAFEDTLQGLLSTVAQRQADNV